MKTLQAFFLGIFSLCASAAAHPAVDFSSHAHKRADSSLVGYLGAFFLGDEPDVYFYLSSNSDPLAFTALNDGDPLIVPTVGTGGVRDPAIVTGGGSEEGKKWYIVGTDLDISKTTWSAAQRTGSLGIYVWESTNLVDWTNERLVTVEDDTAGMVWAPEALWDEDEGKYLVHWASKFVSVPLFCYQRDIVSFAALKPYLYSSSDTSHTGTASADKIRYAYTSDFKTFTDPQTYIDYSPASVIDLTILSLGSSSYARFLKNETATNVFTEISTDGLFGTWTRPGGSSAIIQKNVEGPAAYWDNEVDGKARLLLDFFGGSGYAPYESTDVEDGTWTASSTSSFPSGLRHGSVLPINQTLYDAVKVL
ncbi:MAG: hypothetical protein M1834_000611 [Cirrosporium novae-zelandiae]|nr:MAG: hypothetical protein M1834_000611 [Cirrosporium novae-zelandiae]